MPRSVRMRSMSQVYHVMLRGNNRHDIFLDTDDKSRIIDTIIEKSLEAHLKYMPFASWTTTCI